MKLRQARKIAKRMSARYDVRMRLLEGEAKSVHPAPGHWWNVYRLPALSSAEKRLRRAWLGHCSRHPNGAPESIDSDWYRANRLHSFAVRQPLVKANVRRGWKP